jgi:hypothetical protein
MCMGMSAGQDVGMAASAAGSLTGNPLAIASLITQIAGNGVQAYAQHQQLTKQDAILADGIVKQGMLQKQGEGDVQKATTTMSQSNANAAAKSAQQLQAFQKALQQGSAISSSASPDVPGASKAYKATQGTAGTSANDYVNAIANSAATTQGTQLERVGEGQTMADTASQLGVLSGQSNEQNYVTQLKTRAVQQNPWLNALGQVLKGASMATGFAAGWSGGGKTPGISDPFTADQAAQGAGDLSGTASNASTAANINSMPGAFGFGGQKALQLPAIQGL